MDKKATQKGTMTKAIMSNPLPKLKPGEILFLSPTEQIQYIKGTMTIKAAKPRSYCLEAQGKLITTHTKTFAQSMQIHPLQDQVHHKTISQKKTLSKQQQNQPQHCTTAPLQDQLNNQNQSVALLQDQKW